MKKILKVPYFSQKDNALNPGGSCNVTSVAMCMSAMGIKGDNSYPQLEDQLYALCEKKGYSRHSPQTLVWLFKQKNLQDEFDQFCTFRKIKNHINEGFPVIVHGWWTSFGHIMPIIGYDDEAYNGKGAFVCNDPAGEWSNGYYTGNLNGKHIRYSYNLMDCVLRANSYSQAMDFYNSGKVPGPEFKECWVHKVKGKKLEFI